MFTARLETWPGDHCGTIGLRRHKVTRSNPTAFRVGRNAERGRKRPRTAGFGEQRYVTYKKKKSNPNHLCEGSMPQRVREGRQFITRPCPVCYPTRGYGERKRENTRESRSFLSTGTILFHLALHPAQVSQAVLHSLTSLSFFLHL